MRNAIKNFILDILFPKFCVNCNREGEWLCQDCFSLIDIFEKNSCPFCPPATYSQNAGEINGNTCPTCRKTKKLAGLYCATSYNNFIVKKAINQLKYEPYLKELALSLCSLIKTSLGKLENTPDFKEFILIPVPLHKSKLRKRGFNQSYEIGKCLSGFLEIPIYANLLFKIKKTPAQMELDKTQRMLNLKNAFKCEKPEFIKNKKILLVDDIFTTGSTLEECALALYAAGAQEVRGIVVARA